MIIAVDFDGTITQTNHFPYVDDIREDFVKWLIDARQHGHKLILWTCRCGEHLDNAVKACKKYGLEFDAINDNLPEIKAHLECKSKKVFADMYIDDMAVNIEDFMNRIS